jgi:hypothetical protein
MTRHNHVVVVVNQDGAGKTEGFEAVGNLADLVFGVGAGVCRIAFQFLHRLVGDQQFGTSSLHKLPFRAEFKEVLPLTLLPAWSRSIVGTLPALMRTLCFVILRN